LSPSLACGSLRAGLPPGLLRLWLPRGSLRAGLPPGLRRLGLLCGSLPAGLPLARCAPSPGPAWRAAFG